ncbi:RHS repeat domain-containing protein, partial [Aliikangiella maris]
GKTLNLWPKLLDHYNKDVSYVHVDHLGSTDVITNSLGEVVQEISFDAFGEKRLPNNWQIKDTSIKLSAIDITNRGYTGHEMAEEVGIIHMNGRIYDPRLGRFLQADPYIDGMTDSQGYNRYSYVRNNPLAFTDPTGFKRSGGLKRLQKITSLWGLLTPKNGWISDLYIAIATVTCGPCGAIATAQVTIASGGNLTQGLIAGAKAYARKYIAGKVGGRFGQAVFNGTFDALNGGKFGRGFVGSYFNYNGSNFVIGAIVGGIISKATGGKFLNGAVTGTFRAAYQGGSNSVAKGSDITTGITIDGGQTKNVTQSNLSDEERKKRVDFSRKFVQITGEYQMDIDLVRNSVDEFAQTDEGWSLLKGNKITIQAIRTSYNNAGSESDSPITINVMSSSLAKAYGENNFVKLSGLRSVTHELVHKLTTYNYIKSNGFANGLYNQPNAMDKQIVEGHVMATTNRILKQHAILNKIPLSKVGERTHYDRAVLTPNANILL